MNKTARESIEKAIDMCIEMRKLIQPHGSSQTRLLLDMFMIELGRQLAAFPDRSGNRGDPAS